jgi:hypothetical protein
MKTTKNYVKVDSRNRITIPKALTENLPSVFKIYAENGSIILEPIQEVPKEERWLLDPQNKEIVQELKKALKQKTVDRDLNQIQQVATTVNPKIKKSVEKMMKKYGPALKKLASN